MAVSEGASELRAKRGRERLHELGYAQELRRRMSGFSNFAVSFTIISILSGCLTLYGFGMNTGGPAVIVWGWPFVGIMTLLVGLAMAEVCSSYPTAGGLYYWAAKIAPKNGAAWAWFTGWFNFLGQVAVTAGIDFGAALFLNAFLNLQSELRRPPLATPSCSTPSSCSLHGVLNSVRRPAGRPAQRRQRVVAHPRRAGHRRRAGVRARPTTSRPSFVFTQLVNNTGLELGWIYVVLIGLLHGAVHLHRVRRLGAHDRGDPRRRDGGPARHRRCRSWCPWSPAGCCSIGVTFAIQNYSRRGHLGHRRAAGADLHRRARRHRRRSCCC